MVTRVERVAYLREMTDDGMPVLVVTERFRLVESGGDTPAASSLWVIRIWS
jgi:hypothetical protein